MNFRFLAPNREDITSSGGGKTDNSKPTLKKTSLPQNIIDEEKIDGFLTAMCNVQEIRKVAALPDISFFNEKTSTYEHLTPNQIADSFAVKKLRITMEDGKDRYFRMIDHLPGGEFASGLKATAFVETDESGKFIEKNGGIDLRLNFAGYTSLLDAPQLAETLKEGGGFKSALLRAIYDRAVPREEAHQRSLETVDFVHNIIKRWKERQDNLVIRHIIYGSHSMGAGNALVAQAVSEIEGIPTQTTLAIEQVKAREQADRIKAELSDKNSSLYRKIMNSLSNSGLRNLQERVAAEPDKLEQAIKNNAISVHAFTFKDNGVPKSSISTLVNSKEKFGTEVLQDVSAALQGTKNAIWAEHKLQALLKTAKSGNYYTLESSYATQMPEIITDLAIAPDTHSQTALMAR